MLVPAQGWRGVRDGAGQGLSTHTHHESHVRNVSAATRASGGPSLRSSGAEIAVSCSAVSARSPHNGALMAAEAPTESATLAASAAASSLRVAVGPLPPPCGSQQLALHTHDSGFLQRKDPHILGSWRNCCTGPKPAGSRSPLVPNQPSKITGGSGSAFHQVSVQLPHAGRTLVLTNHV